MCGVWYWWSVACAACGLDGVLHVRRVVWMECMCVVVNVRVVLVTGGVACEACGLERVWYVRRECAVWGNWGVACGRVVWMGLHVRRVVLDGVWYVRRDVRWFGWSVVCAALCGMW
ncbi:hypothetical protein RB195_008160 [Necator americanus]|uniref:Transmembrane protein n=1 Tax=Necator americanus TaxID=51031 RepID=A0ABR1CNM2_NECAM